MQDFPDNSLIVEADVFVFPASFAQARLWFLDQLFPNNSSYNVLTALELTGSLNTLALEQTFNEIVRRHEVLRTNFRMIEGQPVQVIAPTLIISLPVIDLRHLRATEQESEMQRMIEQERSHSFNLSTEPLLRVKLLQRCTEYILILNLHHIICDGWSIGILIHELGTIYTEFSNNKPASFPELALQYADYSCWQREWLQGEILEKQIAYWKQQLDNITLLNLPHDRTRPTKQTYKGKTQYLALPKRLSKELNCLSQRQGVTLFMTLLAAFKTLLYRYTQQEDLVIGSPIANRNRQEIEGLIGFFVNTLVLRTNLKGNLTFLQLLDKVREVALGAYAHQDLPFEKLVEELHPVRTLSHHPLFQVVFSLQNTPSQILELPNVKISQLSLEQITTKFDLEFQLWETSEELKGQITYSTDLFDDITITRMLGHFQTLLEGITANPQEVLSKLPLLTETEQNLLLFEWNKTQTNYPKLSIPHLFEKQAKQTPHAVAVVYENEQLTYGELNKRANQIAHHLQKNGVSLDVLVGICVERSLEMIIGILGILKAGGAYVPLDPHYPEQRLKFILEDAQISVLLTHSSLNIQHLATTPLITYVDNAELINQESQENPKNDVTSQNLAYLIYTSGSTGVPKGVLVQYQGLSNLWQAQINTFNLNSRSRVLQFASLSFDASIFEIVMALLTGARLYLAKKELLLPGKTLIKLLRENAITHITLPPSVLAMLPAQELPALQTIISAGEPCSFDTIKPWVFDRQVYNAYGLTEATVWSTIAQISNEQQSSIGRPIANTQIYILDSHMQPVPIGIPGELYIGGDGLAQGYLKRPELNAEKFIAHNFNNQAETRIYKTGDLATFQSDGNIKYLGRIDEQVKIRGFRIELGEIEAVLRTHSSVQEVVVIVNELSDNRRLFAYIVQNQQQLPLISKTNYKLLLREFLKERLPEYMIPSAFFVVDSLPLTPNGKVDRQFLKRDMSLDKHIEKKLIYPRTATEATLVRIWAKLLNIKRVCVQDNFFELGGDSLLAIRLMSQVKEKLQQDLPLSILFSNPTIEGLANILERRKNYLPWSPLVAIQPLGNKPPFFCVHPIFGTVLPYYELAHFLGRDQPFYGLQPVGIDGQYPPLASIEAMAAYYIKALQTVQPTGPYLIGGWSFGGLVAFEMAQQLVASGQQVALLAILDTSSPTNKPNFWDGYKFLFTSMQYILPFLLDYLYLLIPFTDFISQQLKEQILRELSIVPMAPVFQANSQATLNYLPQPYQGKVTLFKSSEPSITDIDSTLGWSKLCSVVEVNLVPGNHLTMLKKPHVQLLAEQLKLTFVK